MCVQGSEARHFGARTSSLRHARVRDVRTRVINIIFHLPLSLDGRRTCVCGRDGLGNVGEESSFAKHRIDTGDVADAAEANAAVFKRNDVRYLLTFMFTTSGSRAEA